MVSEQIINDQYNAIKQKFPKLNPPNLVGRVWEIIGTIDVIDDEGSYWDSYDVKVVVPEKFPEQLFELHETGNKIPKEPAWHNTISCCLSTNAVMFMEMAGNLTLLNWLEKFAHPYLANHVYKIKTGNYANGEYAHSEPGIIQGYFKIFQTKEETVVIEKLKILTGRKNTSRNVPCFCNSGKKYKRCYLLEPKKHSPGIPIVVLNDDLAQLLKLTQRKK